PGGAAPPRVVDAVDIPELLVFLVAQSGIDEHQPGVVLDQHATQGEGDAVAPVGRDAPLPQRLGNDPEHRATVEMLAAALEGVAAQPADREGGVGHDERGSGNAERGTEAGSSGLLFRVAVRSPSVTAPRSLARSNRRTRSCAVASASPP